MGVTEINAANKENMAIAVFMLRLTRRQYTMHKIRVRQDNKAVISGAKSPYA